MAIQAPVFQPFGIVADPQEFIDSLDAASFSYRDIQGRDVWVKFTPSFTSLTLVGTLSSAARLKQIGRTCFFQVQLAGSTSIASTAGTTYLTLPIPNLGLAGAAEMVNLSSNIAVDLCVISGNKCYLPTQGASGNGFGIAGWYEI